MAKKILAVAVGSPDNKTFQNFFDPDIDKVRPYIRGLVDWLALSSNNRKSRRTRMHWALSSWETALRPTNI